MDKDDGEEDHIGDDDQDERGASPLELDDSADASVRLTGGHGTDAGGVGRQAGAVCRGRLVED